MFISMRITFDDVNFCDGLECVYARELPDYYMGFCQLLKTWLLIAYDTAFYAIIWILICWSNLTMVNFVWFYDKIGLEGELIRKGGGGGGGGGGWGSHQGGPKKGHTSRLFVNTCTGIMLLCGGPVRNMLSFCRKQEPYLSPSPGK